MLTRGEDLQAIFLRLNNEQADWSKLVPVVVEAGWRLDRIIVR